MIPRRLSPPASPLPGPSAADNPASTGSVSPTAQAQPGQLPQTSTIASSSAAFGPGHKRRLPSPVTPRPTRPRTDAAALPAMPAIAPRSHAALQQQTQALSAIAAALGHFSGMEWLTLDEAHRQALLAVASDLAPASPFPGVRETEPRQQHLHEMLSSIQQATQDMDSLANQHQQLPQFIDPTLLPASVSAVHYGGMTIDGPQVTPTGQRCFYLEQQCWHACAQHAVNAMVGGPLVSLLDFARHEAEAQAPQEDMPASRQGIAADMLELGVRVETVQDTLHERGMPMHCYAHVPIAHAQGLDPVQARFLDGLPTDRLLLQADRYEGDSTSSHYVAFRRDGGQWVLLDSLHHAPQHGIAPSAYLLGDEKIKNFTALWPQHALRGQDALVAVDGMDHDRQEGVDRGAHEEHGWQDRQVWAPSVPERIAYPIKTAQNHWKGQRAQEFEPLRQAWSVATGKKSASGGAFLQHLSTKCDEALVAGSGEPVDEARLIFAFEVKTHPEGEAIRVWRGVDSNGSINLRLAPAPNDDEARKALLKAMQNSAKQSAGHRKEKPAGRLSYPIKSAHDHWKGQRAQEFEPMLQAWNRATGTLASGGAFLQYLSEQCDDALVAGSGEPVDEAGLIFEFEVKTHPEGEAMRVWRGVEDNGSINLRLAPAPSDDKARKALLTDMRQSAKQSASQRREKLAGVLPYPSKNAHGHWNGPRAQEFEPLRQAWSMATGTSARGGSFLQHISAQCDKTLATEPVDEAGLIFEFEVKTHPEGEAMRVWRGVDSNGSINLRLAPKPGDDKARKALLKAMQQSAKQSASQRREKPAGRLSYPIKSAQGHWKGQRAQEFEPLRQAWSVATGKKSANGGTFLQHLSAQCDKALAVGNGKPVGEAGLIFEFEVKTHPEGEAIRIWRGVDGNGTINLRLVPALNDDKARMALLTDMQKFAKMSASRRREKPAGELPYPSSNAKDHWKGQRAKEFEPLRQAWNGATGKSASGGAFLQHLSAQCDKTLATQPVDEAGLIFEFEVKTHPEGEAMQVWRGVDGNGSINLRLAPPPDDDKARKALLTAMQLSAKKSASLRREKPASVLSYSSNDATNHWNGPRAKEFEPMRHAWSVATGTSASGGSFLQHLSAQCDKTLATQPVDEAGLIFEFEVKTHPQGQAMRVWRGVDGNGSINLRMAPKPGDDKVRKALLKAMQQSAKTSASRRKEKPTDGLTLEIDNRGEI